MIRLAPLVLLLSTTAHAQTADEYLDKARLEANLLQNTTDRTVYACERDQRDKCIAEAKTAAREARRSLYAIDRAIEVNAVEPPHHPEPTPTPTPTPVTFPKVGDVLPVASGLNVPALLGPKSIPASSAPDIVGAFRFLCGPFHLSYDDPIVYPGQPGKAHLHQFFCNSGVNANTTYESLRKGEGAEHTYELNHSAYWMPAMLDGKGNVVRPDNVSIYYKRLPSTSPLCTTAAKGCVGIPRGLRFVFGWDQTRPNEPQPENAVRFNFKCVQGFTPVNDATPDMVETMKICKPGQWLSATINTPQCWNGVDLDTPDHRSHLAEMIRNASTNYKNACPATHPYIIPQFTMGVKYSIEAGDDPTLWSLASDHMLPPALRRPGASFHSDYWEAWEDGIRLRWERGCLDKMLNCSDGDLGDGQIMARGPHYPQPKASPRLVPVP